MSRPEPEKIKGGICGCLVDCSPEEFPAWLHFPGIDLLEWRIDRFSGKHSDDLGLYLDALSEEDRHPVLATNRPLREMGSFYGPEEARLQILERAAVSGAEWIDIEHDTAEGNVSVFRKLGAKVLVSWHNPVETPQTGILHARLENMCKTGADAIKIVTLAHSAEDNLRILELIPRARNHFGVDLIAFCMGAAGKWSRLVCTLFGSPWTYAQLPGQPEGAPGQFSVSDLRNMLETLTEI